MTRYIDADAMKKLLQNLAHDDWNQTTCTTWAEAFEEVADMIDGTPTADVVERRVGKWIWLSSTYDRVPCEMRYMCSECHHETIIHSNEMSTPWEKFCPNCGAEMEQ